MSGNLIADIAAQPEGEPLRRYANFFDVQFSISEVDLRVGQSFGPGDRPVVHSWLVTTPVHLVTLARTINGAISRYHDQFGPIPGGEA